MNFALNTAAGASWVSFHHGGGVGIGNSLHAGMVIVADGSDARAERLDRVLTVDPGIGVAAPCARRLRAGARNGPEHGDEAAVTAHADWVVLGASELVTCAGFSESPARGSRQGALGIIRDGALAIGGDRVLAVGPSAEIRRAYPVADQRVIDAQGGVVLPGFVDPHTHLIFAGDRAAEWEQRLAGKPYLEILREGGGILSTVQKTRAASFEELSGSARRWAVRCLSLGTTTIEVKSGYCLDREGELKLLEVAAALGRELPLEIVPTFLGAHVVPPEYRERRAAYLELLEELHVEIAAANWPNSSTCSARPRRSRSTKRSGCSCTPAASASD